MKPQSFVFQVLFLGSLDTEFQCFKEKVSFYKHKSCYFKVLFKQMISMNALLLLYCMLP